MTNNNLVLLVSALVFAIQLVTCPAVVSGELFRGASNSGNTIPAIVEGKTSSSGNEAKVVLVSQVAAADNNQFKIACYRDHVNAAQYDAIATDGTHEETNKWSDIVRTVQIDGGRMKVETGESIVIEATMGSLFLYVDDGDITTSTDWNLLQLSMSVQMFQGCISAETCLTGTDDNNSNSNKNGEDETIAAVRTPRTKNGAIRVLDPNPNAAVLLRAHKTTRAENLENSNEYAEFVLDAGGNTGRFFFPEMQSEDYFLVVNFDIIGLTQSSAVSVGLGPHLIVAERFRAQGPVCINEAELVATTQQFVLTPVDPTSPTDGNNR